MNKKGMIERVLMLTLAAVVSFGATAREPIMGAEEQRLVGIMAQLHQLYLTAPVGTVAEFKCPGHPEMLPLASLSVDELRSEGFEVIPFAYALSDKQLAVCGLLKTM